MAFDPRYHDRVVAIAIADGHLLAIRRVHPRHGEFYSFPGGGMKDGEDPTTALQRELKEETGLDATIGREVFVGTIPQGNVQQYFLVIVPYVSVSLPDDAEERDPERVKIRGTYEPCWVSINDVATLNLQPASIAQRVLECISRGFPEHAVDMGALYPNPQ
jgi:8-oxo-dGTP diphosphatase